MAADRKGLQTFEAEAYATDPNDPRKQGRLTESLLSLINPEKEKEDIGSFTLSDGTTYNLWRLYTKTDLEEESETLGHCVGDGNTYYFKIHGDNPDYAIISLRTGDTARYTLEIDLKRHTLLQFKGGGDKPVNSLPEDSELPLKTLSALEQAGITIQGVAEEFEYTIYKEKENFRSETEPLTVAYIRNHSQREIIKGEITLPEHTTAEDFQMVSAIPNLTIDATAVPDTIKDSVTEISGSLVDGSPEVSYHNLATIGGDADFRTLVSAKGLENLTTIGGDAGFQTLISAKGLHNLTTIVDGAYFHNLISAEGLHNLTTIGGNAYFETLPSAKDLHNLTTIGGDAYFETLHSAKGLNGLTTIGGTAYFQALISAEGLHNLTTIGGDAYFETLPSAEGLHNLASIGGDAYFDKLPEEELAKIPALQ